MGEVHAYVTDTHPLIFHAAATARLSRKAARHFDACERRVAITYVPAAVIWETTCLVRVGRVDLKRPVRTFFADLFSNPAWQPLPLDEEQVYLAGEAYPNRDPFDALVCAAARSLSLPLITRDEAIASSGLVPTLW